LLLLVEEGLHAQLLLVELDLLVELLQHELLLEAAVRLVAQVAHAIALDLQVHKLVTPTIYTRIGHGLALLLLEGLKLYLNLLDLPLLFLDGLLGLDLEVLLFSRV